MEYRILGPVELARPAALRPRHRGVLAYLLLNANLVVTIDQIAAAVWGGAAPATVRTQVHVSISAIRRALGRQDAHPVLTTQSLGYRLAVGPGELDADEFARAVERARSATTAGELRPAAELLSWALGLWRGAPLTGATGEFVEAAAARLREQRLSAYEDWAGVYLVLGQHRTVIAGLGAVLDADPLREPLVRAMMTALHRSGYPADALATFRQFRDRLRDEQGLDPGPDTAALHRSILEGAPTLLTPQRAPASQPEEALRRTVQQARASGYTWTQVGQALGTTRQAAFHRFGQPVDPRTRQPMGPANRPDAADRAVKLFAYLADREWELAVGEFDDRVAARLDARNLAALWAGLAGMIGSYERMDPPTIYPAGDYTVVEVPLFFEAGERVGRVSYDEHGRVAGLFLLPPALVRI
jgi:DNA-binding SARP family transcriptional activator